jgi:hypothetical protein
MNPAMSALKARPDIGVAELGYEDPTVSYARTGRAPLDETVRFVGG